MTSPKIWVHKGCGGEVTLELMYSDMENDYYVPVCAKCCAIVEIMEIEAGVTNETNRVLGNPVQ